MQTIFFPLASGLGDVWATVSALLRLSEQENRPSVLNPIFLPLKDEPARNEKRAVPRDLTPLIREVLALFDSKGSLELSYLHPNAQVDHLTAYSLPFLPCRLRWRPSSSRKVCYHLSGIHNGPDKNVNLREQRQFFKRMEELGFEPQPIGLPLALEESANHLSDCLCVIGVDSGLMHVAYSVGTPRFMVRNQMSIEEISKCHGKRSFILAESIWDALEKLTVVEQEVVKDG